MSTVNTYFSFMSTFLQLDRKRLNLSASDVVRRIQSSRASYTRWESGSPIPSDKLLLLSELGFDVQYIVTGVRSDNLPNINNQLNAPHFDFEGKLSIIVKTLEEILKDLELSLEPKDKGDVIEALLMQTMLKKTLPTKEDLYPFLKLVV